jgi:hypothetical protein
MVGNLTGRKRAPMIRASVTTRCPFPKMGAAAPPDRPLGCGGNLLSPNRNPRQTVPQLRLSGRTVRPERPRPRDRPSRSPGALSCLPSARRGKRSTKVESHNSPSIGPSPLSVATADWAPLDSWVAASTTQGTTPCCRRGVVPTFGGAEVGQGDGGLALLRPGRATARFPMRRAG